MNSKIRALSPRRSTARFWKDFWADEQGSNAVEYIAIAALVAIFCFAAWTSFGETISDKVDEKAGDVAGL